MSQRSRSRGTGTGGTGRRPKDVRRTAAGRAGSTSRVGGGRVTGGSATRGLPADPRLVAAAVIGAILVVAAVVFGVMGGGGNAAPSPSDSTAGGGCPTTQPAPLARGAIRTVTLETPKGNIVITVKGSLSPIATGNFVALASCGYYDGVVFHRTAALGSGGAPFVIQGGDGQYGRIGSFDASKVGSGGPGYTITDEPITTTYHRGTVAMARSQTANSQGSQFFIVMSDSAGPTLAGASPGYAILGEVSSGMSVADAIYQASGGQELPSNPIPMTHVVVTDPNATPAPSTAPQGSAGVPPSSPAAS
jgi:peptidyl-prolyl cis-trans isomerase B (cyclophilin B)